MTEIEEQRAPKGRNWKKIGWISGGVFFVLMVIGAVSGDPEEQKVTIEQAANVDDVTTTDAPTTTEATTTTEAPTTTTAPPTTLAPTTTTTTTAPPPPPPPTTTAPPPPPPPATVAQIQPVAPASDCTPGYSPCLPPASDYDCSGGSGNGPAYTGTVSVDQSFGDPYDLDRDGDGVGCE